MSFITKCAFLRFFIGLWKNSRLWKNSGLWKTNGLWKTSGLWKTNRLWKITGINQVHYIKHFLYSQACLIRENVKNGNFCHFPQLDWLEVYKNVRDNIVRNKAFSEILWIFGSLRLLRLGP